MLVANANEMHSYSCCCFNYSNTYVLNYYSPTMFKKCLRTLQ